MDVSMGHIFYTTLPKFVAVQVSSERWQIAELTPFEEGNDSGRPATYSLIGPKLSQGACNNELSRLQK
jgi:hypothetical protein